MSEKVLALQPVPHVAQLTGYKLPESNPLIELNLAATEPTVVAPGLRALVQQIDADSLCHYPDVRALEAALAARLGLSAERVMVTAGADEAIDRACRAMLGPDRQLIVPLPTFEMIPHYAGLVGATVLSPPWPGGSFPLQEVLAHVCDSTGMIAVVTPNNPTGAVANGDDILKLAKGAPHALVVVDGAYLEYADHDLTSAAMAHPNVVVVRTLSKAWGIPGARVGYVAGAAEVVGWLRRAGGVYSVARPSLALAHTRLHSGEADMRGHVARVRHERTELSELLRSLGCEVGASQANFVWARMPNAAWASDALASVGIACRAFAASPEHRRITCPGDAAAFARLRLALVAALRPQAMLFDLDGVLADVSGSYRQAIIETAAHFGVSLTRDDIAMAKARGSANNDWDLTARLMADRGVVISLEQVTEIFERLYQGSEAAPGLRRTERLLCEPDLLARLARRYPLAMVTGRPRRDAERFVASHGLRSHFQHLVCMQDGPLKPDPAPVRLALERLGVQAAWMIGDTPDDVRAARGAGVVPIGVIAPGDDGERNAPVLRKAGAARVLASVSELEGLLP